jgi:hypothetical protein
VKHRVGAATLLVCKTSESPQTNDYSNLIHMLAKHETPMKARRTVRGLVPAKLSTLVISTRSMLVLLSADEMVKPPIRSMMVGENMVEKTHLHTGSVSGRGIAATERGFTYLVASGVDNRSPWSFRMTRSKMRRSGTNMDVTNNGIA